MSTKQTDWQGMGQRFGPAIGLTIILSVLGIAGLSKAGCSNHHIKPGHYGYIKSKPLAGEAEFLTVIKGPASTGWVWRQEAIQVDVRPRTYKSEMTVRDREENPVTLRAHAIVGVRTDGDSKQVETNMRRVVEEFSADAWYDNNVRREFELAVRIEVQKRKTFEIKDDVDQITEIVKRKMDQALADKPFYFESVNIGKIQYTDEVVEAVIENKMVDYEVEKLKITQQIELFKARIKEEEARGIADAQRQISATLTPMFVQWEALNAMKGLINSDNTSFVIAPMSPDGMSPVIMNLSTDQKRKGGK